MASVTMGLCCVAVWFLATPAPPPSAESSGPVELRWRAPSECPDQAAINDGVMKYLNSQELAFGTVADGEVTRDAAGFVLHLQVHTDLGDNDERVSSTDCAVLADLAALKIAMAIDPVAVLGSVRPTGSSPVSAQSIPQPTPPTKRRPPPPTVSPRPAVTTDLQAEGSAARRSPAPRRVRGLLALTSGLGYGVLPGVGAPIRGTTGILASGWRIEAEATWWLARRAAAPAQPTAGGNIRLVTGGIRGCPQLHAGSVSFPVCAGIEVGSMHGAGVGLSDPQSARRLWAAASFGAGLWWAPRPMLAFGARAQSVIAFRRIAFAMSDLGEVHRSRAVAIRGLAGFELRFP